jgi:hypothetical protein
MKIELRTQEHVVCQKYLHAHAGMYVKMIRASYRLG